ncbi:MAG: VOC family protein [Acidimicrobiia bacterium]|nr:VOC family protein [Acidimicrobiia bacterium]
MSVDPRVARTAGVSYLHIPARDVAASAQFYEEVFGWEVDSRPGGAMSFSDGTGHVIGRWVTDQAVAGRDGLRAYIYVDDVDETLAAARSHGGQLVAAPYAEGTLTIALISDPAGNVVGIWQGPAGDSA